MTTDYNVLVRRLSKEEGGGYLAQVPALPGCMSDGKTRAEALRNVEDAIDAWIEAARKMGRPIPVSESEASFSGRLILRAPRSLHRELAQRAEIEGVSINQLMVALLSREIGSGRGAPLERRPAARVIRYKRAPSSRSGRHR